MSDPPWTRADFIQAIKGLKFNKASDECGLTAGLLKTTPEEFLIAMLDAFNFVLHTGHLPASWRLTLFTMLPKKLNAIQTSDLEPLRTFDFFKKN